ncbi:hypothetical protein [Methanococcoides burtonii]|uniref:Uncharacterized protein n=1 Tax=Methanococcoides burtonii (strain DSM 6242 / NBRC 107633 / OCM 468 / ACE-M) TaxID=259564 RepID=Q12XA9_METBU|nr:hypothetical protein [Methanococcoides burtonii]ABE51917.1 Hypothetical protein Mbur_0977 [Methanococcoides burtonii DSM 6242]
MGWIDWGDWNGDWSDVPQILETRENYIGEYTEIIAALVVKVIKVTWLPFSGTWLYQCRLKSVGKVRLNSGSPPFQLGWGSYRSFIKLEKVESGDSAFSFTYDTSVENLGGYPHSGNHANYDTVNEIIALLTTAAISQMSQYVSYGLTAAQLIGLLCGIPDDTDNTTEYLNAEYHYSSDVPINGAWSPESSCWYSWEMRAKGNDVVRFKLNYEFNSIELMGSPWIYYVGNNSTWILVTPPPPSQMSSAEKEAYGLIEIPVNSIEKHASEFNLSTERVREHMDFDEPLYVIAKPNVTVETSISKSGKKMLSNDVDVKK